MQTSNFFATWWHLVNLVSDTGRLFSSWRLLSRALGEALEGLPVVLLVVLRVVVLLFHMTNHARRNDAQRKSRTLTRKAFKKDSCISTE